MASVSAIARVLETSGPIDATVALVICDLDRFHRVNEALGFVAGDALLRELAGRLAAAAAAAPSGALVQIDGDRFLITFTEVRDDRALDDAVERLRRAVDAPVRVDDLPVYVSATFGRHSVRIDGSDPSAAAWNLLRFAEIDLYRAKDRRSSPAPIGTRFDLVLLDSDLHLAVENREVLTHFQPIYETSSERITGFETLARWPHPELGFVPPEVFIALAEDDGLIHALGEQILRQAYEFLLAVSDPAHRVYVNVSPHQLAEPGFAALVSRTFGGDRSLLERLVIEVTESSLILDPARAVLELTELRALGLGVAIDDFGSGYSSLALLQELPVTELKVDRQLVQRDGAVGHAVLSAIVRMASGLGLAVVAEGVESAEQLDLLRLLGCDRVQGFLLAPPLPADLALELPIERWVRNPRRAVRGGSAAPPEAGGLSGRTSAAVRSLGAGRRPGESMVDE